MRGLQSESEDAGHLRFTRLQRIQSNSITLNIDIDRLIEIERNLPARLQIERNFNIPMDRVAAPADIELRDLKPLGTEADYGIQIGIRRKDLEPRNLGIEPLVIGIGVKPDVLHGVSSHLVAVQFQISGLLFEWSIPFPAGIQFASETNVLAE